MRICLLLLSMLPMTAFAGQIYKCTDKLGNTAFQQQPCSQSQGKAEVIDMPSAPTTQWQPTPQQPEDPYAQALEDIQRSEQQRQADYDRRIQEIDQQHCQYYRDQLTDVQERWQTLKRQGYTQKERDRWENRIASRQRDVERECR